MSLTGHSCWFRTGYRTWNTYEWLWWHSKLSIWTACCEIKLRNWKQKTLSWRFRHLRNKIVTYGRCTQFLINMSTKQAQVDKDGFNAVDQLSATGFGISKIFSFSICSISDRPLFDLEPKTQKLSHLIHKKFTIDKRTYAICFGDYQMLRWILTFQGICYQKIP